MCERALLVRMTQREEGRRTMVGSPGNGSQMRPASCIYSVVVGREVGGITCHVGTGFRGRHGRGLGPGERPFTPPELL